MGTMTRETKPETLLQTTGMWGGKMRKRQTHPKQKRTLPTAPPGGNILAENVQRTPHKQIPVANSPVPRCESTGCSGRPPARGGGARRQGEIRTNTRKRPLLPQIVIRLLPRPWPDTERGGSAGLRKQTHNLGTAPNLVQTHKTPQTTQGEELQTS